MPSSIKFPIIIAVLVANPILVSGAFSFSQSVALARKPILVKTAPGVPSAAIKIGKEGKPATSADQDLELTRQLIMAHFDAVDEVSSTRVQQVSTIASTSKHMEMTPTIISLAEEAAEQIPKIVLTKDIANAIKASRKNTGYISAKGIGLFGHLSRGLGLGSRRLTTALGFKRHRKWKDSKFSM